MTKQDNKISDNKFIIIFTCIYGLIVFIGLFYHEMWRDETEAWMIVRESTNFLDLIQNTRYQGHPIIWHIMLFGLTKISHNPILMQILHGCIATFNIWLLVKSNLFTRIEKILMAGGYFFLYEYAIISRNYAIGFTFLLLLLHLKNRSIYWVPLLCGLMVNSNGFMAVIGGCLFATYIIDLLIKNRFSWAEIKRLFLPSLIFLVFFILFVIQVIPPKDGTTMVGNSHLTLDGIAKAGMMLSAIIIYIPRFFIFHSWDTLILYDFTLILFSIVIFIICVKYIFTSNQSRIFFILSVTGILLFEIFFYPGAHVRHRGHYLIAFLISVWMMREQSNDRTKIQTHFFTIVLYIQCFSGISSYVKDIIYPFSNGKEVAEYIRSNYLENEIIIGTPDFAVSTVSGYLDKPIYYPERRGYGTFMVWSKIRGHKVSIPIIEDIAIDLMEKDHKKEVLFITNEPETIAISKLRIKEKIVFDKALQQDENLIMYRLVK